MADKFAYGQVDVAELEALGKAVKVPDGKQTVWCAVSSQDDGSERIVEQCANESAAREGARWRNAL